MVTRNQCMVGHSTVEKIKLAAFLNEASYVSMVDMILLIIELYEIFISISFLIDTYRQCVFCPLVHRAADITTVNRKMRS